MGMSAATNPIVDDGTQLNSLCIMPSYNTNGSLGSSKMGNQVVRLGSKQELSANGANISDHCVVIGSNHPRGSEAKGLHSVAIGYASGNTNQANYCVSIGSEAGGALREIHLLLLVNLLVSQLNKRSNINWSICW